MLTVHACPAVRVLSVGGGGRTARPEVFAAPRFAGPPAPPDAMYDGFAPALSLAEAAGWVEPVAETLGRIGFPFARYELAWHLIPAGGPPPVASPFRRKGPLRIRDPFRLGRVLRLLQVADGRRREKWTGAARKPDAVAAVHRLILEEYRQVAPSAGTVPWEAAQGQLHARGLRSAAQDALRLPGDAREAEGPVPTGPLAGRRDGPHGRGLQAGVRRRDVHPQADTQGGGGHPAYARKGKSLDTRLRTRRAMSNHFLTMSPPLVGSNPFAGVTPPKLDLDVKYVTRADEGSVFAWLGACHEAWGMPKLFFQGQCPDGLPPRRPALAPVVRPAGRQAGVPGRGGLAPEGPLRLAPRRRGRRVGAVQGAEVAVGVLPGLLRAATVRLGFPVNRTNPEFSPRRLDLWVVRTMRTYQKQTGKVFSSHDFRKAAFTRTAEKDLHPKRVASGSG